MRVVWLTPLLLASACLSCASADDQPSCGVFYSDQDSDCSVSPTLSRVPRGVKDPLATPDSRSTRTVKHKRRARPHKRSRVVRSTQEDFEVVEEGDGHQPSNAQRLPYPHYHTLQGDWRNVVRQVQAPAFVASPRYCPHCRQILPAYFDHRMLIPLQTPRFQAIPIQSPPPYEHQEEFSNSHVNGAQSFQSEESCPYNYQTDGESDPQPLGYLNHTSLNPSKRKDYKKTPPGFSSANLDSVTSKNSSSPPTLTKKEMSSVFKKSNLPNIEELTKYLEKKKNNN